MKPVDDIPTAPPWQGDNMAARFNRCLKYLWQYGFIDDLTKAEAEHKITVFARTHWTRKALESCASPSPAP